MDAPSDGAEPDLGANDSMVGGGGAGGEGPAGKEAARPARKRRPRWLPDTDPFRGRVLYYLAAKGYKERYGRTPKPRDLNHEYPASGGGAKTYGAWNRLAKGKSLPRAASAPQGVLMKKLSEMDPAAAASYSWSIWRLASSAPLTLQGVHALMLALPPGIAHQLIGRFRNGRCLRWPTDRLTELEWLIDENSLDGIAGLVALMREAELLQHEALYDSCYGAMCWLLPVLDSWLGQTLAGEFAAFLKSRFRSMAHIVANAYETEPTVDVAGSLPVRAVLSDGPREITAAEFEWQWKGMPPHEPGSDDSDPM